MGSHACKALAQARYTPVAYDNLVYGHPWAVRWGPLEVGDIAERARLDAVISDYRPTVVMHFADCAYAGESVLDPGKYYRNNVARILSLVEAMRDRGIGHMVSPAPVPPTASRKPSPSTSVTRSVASIPTAPPNSWSSASSRISTRLTACVPSRFGTSTPPERTRTPRSASLTHDRETWSPWSLMPPLARAPLSPFAATTTTLPTAPASATTSNVTDLARSHRLALKALERGSAGTVYNLGNGQGFSVREVIDCAASVTGRSIPVQIDSRWPSDPPRLVGDAWRVRR